MNKLFVSILHWVPLAIAITLVLGVVEVSVQQSYRMNANDPQVTYVGDVARSLQAGNKPTDLINPAGGTLDIANTLSTFVAMYDANGAFIVSNAKMDGAQLPNLPAGVFDYTKTHGEDRITWQPRDGVRIAAVVAYVSGTTPYYVVAGRSLREVEKREADLMNIVLLGWAVTLVATLVATLGVRFLSDRKRTPTKAQ